MCTELCLGRRLVQLGRIEFASSVDGKLKQLGRGCVVGFQSGELGVLLLPGLSASGNTVIKHTSGLLHDLDPGLGVGQLVLELLNVVLVTCDLLGERLRVIFRLVEVLQRHRPAPR